jgi:Tfp pilus assembly protein PilF
LREKGAREMADTELLEEALELLQKAYEYQMDGELELAIETYKLSIDTYPTAEAHTFLGWTYSFQGRLLEAIEECKKAIRIDPDFGNPYNDIGAYLIELQRYDEAIYWLEKAKHAKRYEPRHYPYYNLGRVYLIKGMIKKAREEFEKALALYPGYVPAIEALEKLEQALN